MIFRRHEKQPSSTTFIATVDIGKLKEVLSKLAEEGPVAYLDDCLNFGDCPSALQGAVFWRCILPRWKEIVKKTTEEPYIKIPEPGCRPLADRKDVGMLVVVPETACEWGCPWCYAKDWFGGTDLRFDEDSLEASLKSAISEITSRGFDHLSIVVGGGADPLASWNHTRLVQEVFWIIGGMREEMLRKGVVLHRGLSTSMWFADPGFAEDIPKADVFAITVLDEDLRSQHPKLKDAPDRLYIYSLAEAVEEISDNHPDAEIHLAFIFPHIDAWEVLEALERLKLKTLRKVKCLILHPHSWREKMGEDPFLDWEDFLLGWERAIDDIFNLPLSNFVQSILIDACFVKKFTEQDLCSGGHWRLYVPSLRFEEVLSLIHI